MIIKKTLLKIIAVIVFAVTLLKMYSYNTVSYDQGTPAFAPLGDITNTETTIITEKYSLHLLDVPYINQNNGYPTGCEAVSAAMVLNYYGYEISPEEFIDIYLNVSPLPHEQNGITTAESPWNSFIGSPYNATSYGCYSTVIENALWKIIDNEQYYIVRSSSDSMETLCENYIKNGIPVIIWATAEMRKAYVTDTWITTDGDSITWIAPEHCLVLTGFDKDYYYFNDPRCEKNTSYKKSDVEAAYNSLKCQSVAIARWY